MSNSRLALLILFWLPALGGVSFAADQEGCLFCHRLEIARAGSGVADLRVTEKAGTTHAGLYCSDCHPDAKMAPHAVVPAGARCIEECHATGAGTVPESHRKAAFGGLTEKHRRTAMPASPCMLCHKDSDPPSTAFPASARCAGCHPGQAASLSEGVHARLSATSPGGGCPACHVPHPAPGGASTAAVTCKRPGCHDVVDDRKRRLAVHGKSDAPGMPGRKTAMGVFALAALLGILPGRLFCGNPRSEAGGE
jgi:hypothetical protein